jgi:hypothetical protein
MGLKLSLARWTAAGAGIVAFAGCGNGVPQTHVPAVPVREAQGAKSWMLPEAKSEDLLYLADSFCCLRVFSYPKGKPVGVVTDVDPELDAECSDKNGNVWVTSFGVSQIVEYAHGATAPKARLTEPRNTDPWGCSVDPITGNLAVTNTNSTLAIFPQAQGSPTIYSGDFEYCTYDNDGNLFADKYAPGGLFELPSGGSTFTQVTLSKTFVALSIQWDGENLAIVSERVHVSGTTGTVINNAILRGNPDYWFWAKQFWVQGSTIVGPGATLNDTNGLFDFWRYPAGGKPKKSIQVTEIPGIGAPGFYGATVSVAPK